MSLKGNGVRIVVDEPEGWGVNLFGIIKYERGDVLFVELSKPMKGNRFSSALLKLKPKKEGQTFKALGQYYSELIVAALVNPENSEDLEQILSGTITID